MPTKREWEQRMDANPRPVESAPRSEVDSICRTNHDPSFRRAVQEAFDAGRDSQQSSHCSNSARVRLSEVRDMRKAVTVIEGYGQFSPGQDGFVALAMLRKFFDVLANENIPYGYCPHCGALGVSRERRPDGNDKCQNGHVYPSRAAR